MFVLTNHDLILFPQVVVVLLLVLHVSLDQDVTLLDFMVFSSLVLESFRELFMLDKKVAVLVFQSVEFIFVVVDLLFENDDSSLVLVGDLNL